MDRSTEIPDEAIARLLARLHDIADGLSGPRRDELRAAITPPYGGLSYVVYHGVPPVVVVTVWGEDGAWRVAELDATTIGVHLVGNGLIYLEPDGGA